LLSARAFKIFVFINFSLKW